MKSVSLAELREMMMANDIEKVAETMSNFTLRDGKIPFEYGSSVRKLTSMLLGLAAAMSRHDQLKAELAATLVEYTAMCVNIFPFLNTATLAMQIDTASASLPREVKAVLQEGSYSTEAGEMIEKMDESSFEAMLAYLVNGGVNELSSKFNLPIIRYIRAKRLMPDDLMFAMMGLHLKEADNDAFGPLIGLLGLGPFSFMARDWRDDDETGEPDDETGGEPHDKPDGDNGLQ